MNTPIVTPKIIVVGATGYIGAHLLFHGQEICVVKGTSSSGLDGHLPLRLDATSDFDYGKIHAGDIVLLTASISAPDVCSQEYERAWAVNVTGTSNFIMRLLDCGARVIFFSSDTVFGERDVPFDETAAVNPAGEYAEMKYEVEQRFMGHSSVKIIRLSYVFSREDKFSRYLIGSFDRNLEADVFHPFFRSIVHRDDIVKGVLALAMRWEEVPEQFINFGGAQVLSRIDFAECIREISLHNLRFKVIDPGIDFFKNRPRIIAMKSPIFQKILGREPVKLFNAMQIEFSSPANTGRNS